MTKITIPNEKTLVDLLASEISKTEKESIKIVAGNLPMRYYKRDAGKFDAGVDVDRWGQFSLYTFAMGCQLVKYARDEGKQAGLLVVVDDALELPFDEIGQRIQGNRVKTPRRDFYQAANFPEQYQQIADHYEVTDAIVEQARSFGSSKLISELQIKLSALDPKQKEQNDCVATYSALLADPQFFDKQSDYLISFIPGQCRGNISEGILDKRDDLDASHVFFPHIRLMGGLMGKYIFREVCDPMPIPQMYEQDGIIYQKSVSKP